MYGLIFVEPKGGLPKVDREYYLMQSDFYTKGTNGEQGLQPFSMTKAIDERPDYVVFNGSVGSTAGDQALTAKVGETVRLFVGDGGPNLTSSFHVIGQIFDTVYPEGNLSTPTHNVQTTMIPAGGSAIVDFKLDVPGTFIIVDHSLTRAFNRGALAQMKITGDENKLIYSGKMSEEVYMPEGAGARLATQQSIPAVAAKSRDERIKLGASIYANNCQACHQAQGEGIPDAFPPLANSDYLNADKVRSIKVVTGGLEGELTVNGKVFNGVMPAWSLPDEDIANVMTYIHSVWNNSNADFTPDEIKAARVKSVE